MTTVLANRFKRLYVSSKFREFVRFAIVGLVATGITSFSVQPLRIITLIGLLCLGISIVEIIYILVAYFQGRTIQGWASLLFSMWFFGGLLLFSIGVVGEYVGKIYKEVKRRPRYIIEKQI